MEWMFVVVFGREHKIFMRVLKADPTLGGCPACIIICVYASWWSAFNGCLNQNNRWNLKRSKQMLIWYWNMITFNKLGQILERAFTFFRRDLDCNGWSPLWTSTYIPHGLLKLSNRESGLRLKGFATFNTSSEHV